MLCPVRSLGCNTTECASYKNVRKGVEDHRLHCFPFQRMPIVDELLGKFAATGHKSKKVCCRLMIRNNLKK